MAERRRWRDGAGWGDNSFKKHTLVELAVKAQRAVLDRVSPGRGVIIDMHAGTGEGVPSDQLDLFREARSDATAVIAEKHANLGAVPADLVLCESNRERRATLEWVFGGRATVLSSNARVPIDVDLGRYSWTIVLNDPCGHSGHAVDVMQRIAAGVRMSDFVVVLNEGSLNRHLGLGSGSAEDDRLVAAARASKERYEWMTDHREWARRLGKKHVACARFTVNNKAFRGRVMLITNYVASGIKDWAFRRAA